MKFRGNYEVTKKISSEDLEVSNAATLKDITASSVVLDGTGSADLGGSPLLNVGTPTDANAAVNRQYFEDNKFSISTGSTPPTDAVDGDLFITAAAGDSRLAPPSVAGSTPRYDIASNGSRVMIVGNNEANNIVAYSDDNMVTFNTLDAGFNADDTYGSAFVRAAGQSEWFIWPGFTSQGKSRGRYTNNNGDSWDISDAGFGGAADSWNDEAVTLITSDPDHTTSNTGMLVVPGRPTMITSNDGRGFSITGQTAPAYRSADTRNTVTLLLKDDSSMDLYVNSSFTASSATLPTSIQWDVVMFRKDGKALVFSNGATNSNYAYLTTTTGKNNGSFFQPAPGGEEMFVSGAVDNISLDCCVVWSETKKAIWCGNASTIADGSFTKATITGDLENFPTKIVSHGANGFVGINETTGITSWSADGTNWTISVKPELGEMRFHSGEWLPLPYTSEQDVVDLIASGVDLSGYLPKTGGTLTGELVISGAALDFQGTGNDFVTINDAKMTVGTTDTVFQGGTFAIKATNPLIENGNLTVDGGNVLVNGGNFDVTNGNIEVTGGSTIVGDFEVKDNSTILVGTGSTVNLNGNKLLNLANPTNPQDAATKAYVDGLPSGVSTFFLPSLPAPQAEGDIAFTYTEGIDRSPNAAIHDPSFTTALHYDLGFGPDKIIVTNGTTAYKYSLNNGETWLDGTFPEAVSTVWYNGTSDYYAFPAGGNTVYTSLDGISWVASPVPVDATHVAESNTAGNVWNISPEFVFATNDMTSNTEAAITVGNAVVKDVNILNSVILYNGFTYSSNDFANVSSRIHHYHRSDGTNLVTALTDNNTNVITSNHVTASRTAAPSIANVTWTDHTNLGWVFTTGRDFSLLFGTGPDSHKAMYRFTNNNAGTWVEFDATGGVPLNARTSMLNLETGRMVIVGDEGFFYADFGVPNANRMFDSANFLSAIQAGGFFNQATYAGDLASLPDSIYSVPGSDKVFGINHTSGAITYSTDGGINWVAVAKEITEIHIADADGWQTIEPLRTSVANEIYAKKTGGQYSGTLDMNNNSLIGLPTPGGDTHATPKIYVDDLAGHIEVANSVAIHASTTVMLAEVRVDAEPCLFIDVFAKNTDGSKAYMATFHALRNDDGSEMNWTEFGTIRIGGADVHIELQSDAWGNIEIRGRSATEQYKVKMKIRKMDV